MTSTATIAPRILAGGGALEAGALAALTSVRIRRGLNVVGEARLRFNDQGYPLAVNGRFSIGAPLEVRAHNGELFAGTIQSVALDHSRGQVPELVVTAHEATHRLTRHRPPRTFENQSVERVIQTIATEARLTVAVDKEVALDQQVPYLMQTGTDLSLLDELVRTAGAVWWHEPPHTVSIGASLPPAGSPVPLTLDDKPGGLLAFSVRASAGQPTSARTTGWDPVRKEQVTGEARAEKAQPGPGGVESAFVHGAREDAALGIVTNAGDPVTREEADDLAAAILASARSDVVTGRGTAAVDARIVPGTGVKIEDAGPASGTYHVTSVEHTYDVRGFHTTFRTGSLRPRALVDTLGGETGRPDARVDGVLVGIVTDVKDPDNLGRVRARFPVLGDDRGGTVVSAWARVATFDAGDGRGATFLPEIDDEVLVAFENGNTRRPVVIGSVFGGRNRQPSLETLLDDGEIHARRMTSRAGHVFEMGDQVGEERLLLRHGTEDYSISLDAKARAVTVQATGGELKLTNGKATVTLDASGNITIQGQSLKVEAQRDVTVDAQFNANVKAGMNLSAEGTNTTIKGNATATVQGGANTAIKGATVAIN